MWEGAAGRGEGRTPSSVVIQRYLPALSHANSFTCRRGSDRWEAGIATQSQGLQTLPPPPGGRRSSFGPFGGGGLDLVSAAVGNVSPGGYRWDPMPPPSPNATGFQWWTGVVVYPCASFGSSVSVNPVVWLMARNISKIRLGSGCPTDPLQSQKSRFQLYVDPPVENTTSPFVLIRTDMKTFVVE